MIEFDQSAWLAPYIDFNTQLRTRAKKDLEKDFFKLMNNLVFGKTIENTRKHRDMKLLMNKKMYLKKVVKPNFKLGIVFSENLMGCEMRKVKVVIDKLIYSCRNSIMTTSSPRMVRIFCYVTWTLTPSFTTLKPIISTKTLSAVSRLGST